MMSPFSTGTSSSARPCCRISRQVDVELDRLAVARADQRDDVGAARQRRRRPPRSSRRPCCRRSRSGSARAWPPGRGSRSGCCGSASIWIVTCGFNTKPPSRSRFAISCLRLRDREAADGDGADQREVDLADLGDARLDRQIGVLVDRDPHDVADAEHRLAGALRARWPRNGDRRPRRRKQQRDDEPQRSRAGARQRCGNRPASSLQSLQALVESGIARHRRRPSCRSAATSTCGAALTAEAGSVAGTSVSGGSSGRPDGRPIGRLRRVGGELARRIRSWPRARSAFMSSAIELALALVEQELLDRRRRLLLVHRLRCASRRGTMTCAPPGAR